MKEVMHPGSSLLHLEQQVAAELAACICCNECLLVCPALDSPIHVRDLNEATMTAGSISEPIARFARSCYQCGVCATARVCPVGLHRDAMMVWLKVRLLRSGRGEKGS